MFGLESNFVAKNFGMDWVLLALCVFFFVRGFWKGFLSMLFSLVGTFALVTVAWALCGMLEPIVEGWIGKSINSTLTQILNGAIPGQFSDLAELQAAIGTSKFALLFNLFLTKILGNLTIDGSMSAGEILAPTLSMLLVKVISFAILFVALFVVLRIVFFILSKIVKNCGLGTGNRILGGALGLVKGLVVFAVVYFVISTLANLLLNQTLLEFVQSGEVSKFLYENLIMRFLKLIY